MLKTSACVGLPARTPGGLIKGKASASCEGARLPDAGEDEWRDSDLGDTGFFIVFWGLSMGGLVSVIVPSYNCAEYIAETLVSLSAQNYSCWEAIVVDDGSVDGTEDVVRKISSSDSRVRYVFQPNSGVSSARNHGIRLAKGQYILFLDADDLITPNVLRAHVESFKSNPRLGMSCVGFQYFAHGSPGKRYSDYSLRRPGVGGNKFFGGGDVVFPAFIRKNFLPLQSAMFCAALIGKVGCFDESMRALEDWEYVLRSVVSGAEVISVSEVSALALIRVRSGSATKTLKFSDYMDRVYGNVRAEIVKLLDSADVVRGRFYLFCLDVQLLDLARRRKIKSEKILILEMASLIKVSGLAGWRLWFDLCRSYGTFRVVRAFSKSARLTGKGVA